MYRCKIEIYLVDACTAIAYCAFAGKHCTPIYLNTESQFASLQVLRRFVCMPCMASRSVSFGSYSSWALSHPPFIRSAWPPVFHLRSRI